MSLFLTLMIAGLIGMIWMALPGLFQTGGHAGHDVGQIGHGSGPLAHTVNLHGNEMAHPAHVAVPHAGHSGARGAGRAGSGRDTSRTLWRFLPSPRTVFSSMTLIGAFGYALAGAVHLPVWLSGLLAFIPAFLLERFAITPLWNLMLRFQGAPSSPLEQLVYSKVQATTTFQNGRGMVSAERDGQIVQLRAELTQEQARNPVRVGDTLRIESVDADNERVTVTLS